MTRAICNLHLDFVAAMKHTILGLLVFACVGTTVAAESPHQAFAKA